MNRTTYLFSLSCCVVLLTCGEKQKSGPASGSGRDFETNSAGVGSQDEIIVPSVAFQQYSGGSDGAPAGLTVKSFRTTKGLQGEYTVHGPADREPRGLLVYLHGSGNAGAYGSGMAAIKAVADEFSLIPLLVKTVRTDSWLQGGIDNNDYLDEILQKDILPVYNVDRGRIFFAGSSGGAVFLTGFFVPALGYKYRGGVICLCGGEMSILNGVGGININDDLRRYLPVSYHTQQGDYMYEQVRGGAAYYTAKKMRVKADYPPGGGHCSFDTGTVLREKLAEIVAGAF